MAKASNAKGKNQDEVQHMLLRGSLFQLRRRCGKPNCHCREGELHSTWALSYSIKGKTRILTLRAKDLPAVRQALRRYKQAAAMLEEQALGGIKALAERIRREKAERKRGGDQ